MQNQSTPLTQDLVLVGGGHTHALLLRRWGMKLLPGTRVTLIDPGPTAAYSGMLPGHLAGHYTRDALDIDLVRLARFAGARFLCDSVVGMNAPDKTLQLASGNSFAFDVASFDVGITSGMPKLAGFSEHAVPAKPLGPFAHRWRRYLTSVPAADVAVIGAGVAGAEIAMALAHALRTRGTPYSLHLIDRGAALTALPTHTANRLKAEFKALHISVLENKSVLAITEDSVVMEDQTVRATFVCGAAGALPHAWQAVSGLATVDGYFRVNPFLETSMDGIFAVGDCAHMDHAPRPKAGVYAVRQAPFLFENLRARLMGAPPKRRYQPQKDYLKLISLGAQSAVGERFGQVVQGPWVWRWKDRIDQEFMQRFKDLPPKRSPALPSEMSAGLEARLKAAPLCGGCAAKLGQTALQSGLSTYDDGTLDMPGDDAAILRVGAERIVMSTDHLRGFLPDPSLLAEVAVQHALGDIWAMGATPHAATLNIILPEMSDRLASRSLSEIMDASRRVMQESGAEIVGGHSTFGAEMTIGVTLIGRTPRRPITLDGARPGDLLILTKPLGSGVILAAEMAGQARGAWVMAALEQMKSSQARPAQLLKDAHAMTDVTGFGLLGHLRNICLVSKVGARVRLEDVPTMEGVEKLFAAGQRATLHEQNRAPFGQWPDDPNHAALWDPQTSGGLLAAVSRTDTSVLSNLHDAAIPATVIGEITDKPGHIDIV